MLVTNRHVVENADEVQISTWNGRSFTSPFAAVALYSDLALVALDQPAGAAPKVAEDDPAPGDDVFAAGYPGGGKYRVTAGEVLRYMPAQDPQGGSINVGNAIVLSAAVRPGNSGGPLLNDRGEVVGVVYAYLGSTGEGLALPVSTLRRMAGRLASGDPSGWAPAGC